MKNKTDHTTTSKPSARARQLAKEALKALATEDLIYAHAGAVCSRPPETARRLAEFFEIYAAEQRSASPA